MQTLNALTPPLHPCPKNHFGVRAGLKDMAQALEMAAQLTIVIDFSVEDDRNATFLREHRLAAGLQINDRQPAVTQSKTWFEMKALPVRPPMLYGVVHSTHQRLVRRSSASGIKPARNPTHANLGRFGRGESKWRPKREMLR